MSILYTAKTFIKKRLQILAALLGPHTRTPKKNQLLILMYHRILPIDDDRSQLEEPGMIVTPETFRHNLEIASEYFEFIKLSEWIDKKQNNIKLPDKACAITFDDGWADNHEFAFPILKEMNIPATIYLVADMVDTKKQFWPERLARTISTIAAEHSDKWSTSSLKWICDAVTKYNFSNRAPSKEEISQIIAHCKHLPDQEIHKRLSIIESELNLNTQSNNTPILNWSQINEMTTSGLIELGSHTCQHIRLGKETPSVTLEHEIIQSKKIIEKKSKQPVKTFCFPNGDYSNDSLELVKEHYSGTVTTTHGWNTEKSNLHLLKRIGLHEDIANNKTAFLARISGLMK